MGWRNITNTTNERTMIASLLPICGVGHAFPLAFPKKKTLLELVFLLTMLNSLVLDYCVRQKMGGTNLTYHILKQLPIYSPEVTNQQTPWDRRFLFSQWICDRIAELTYVSRDMAKFAEDTGLTREPFPWDDERRFLIRCELDAAFFHLYGLARDDVEYILDTFPIVKRTDEKTYGEYRTARTIIGIYDAMAEAIAGAAAAAAYETPLD